MTNEHTLPYELMAVAAQEEARAKAVNITGPCLVVWDFLGFCRVYSTCENNRHFSVPSLNQRACNYSRTVHI